jgi:DNA-binding ferritin-like protein
MHTTAWQSWLDKPINNSAFDWLSSLAVRYRAMQFFAHIGHNNVTGPTFTEDHEWLGELYGTYEGAYDGLVERMIGLDTEPDLFRITDSANAVLQSANGIDTYVAGGHDWFGALLLWEQEVCGLVEQGMKDPSITEATKNFIAGLADESEQRQYKLKQRLM